MEEHFLKDFVSGPKGIKPPVPYYNPHGDCITFQLVDEAIVADGIDDVLTIYRSVVTNKPIGYQLKNVQAIARQSGCNGVMVQHEHDCEELKQVTLNLLLLTAYEQGSKTLSRKVGYAEALASCSPNPRIKSEDLELAFPES